MTVFGIETEKVKGQGEGELLFCVSRVFFSIGFLLIQLPIFRLFGHGHEYNEIFKNSVYKELKVTTLYSSIFKNLLIPL